MLVASIGVPFNGHFNPLARHVTSSGGQKTRHIRGITPRIRLVFYPSADCGAVHAADGGIVSSDIVGYATQGIAGGKLNCVALQFADVGSVSEQASFDGFSTSGLTAGVYDTMNTDAPCIMFFNGVGYDYYYYISDAFDADGNEVTAWADAGGDATDNARALGAGFWLRVPEGTCDTGTMTQAGKVNSDSDTKIELAAGLTLAGNPYPEAVNFTKITTAGLVAGNYDTMNTDAPCIMFYNGVGYDYYYYISDAFDADGNEVTAWADAGGDAATADVASAGKAFWARTSTAGSLTFVL